MVTGVKMPAAAAGSYVLARGVEAVAPGLAWLPGSRTLIAADAHLAYEDVVGGALPLWSTAEIVATLGIVARAVGAREIIFLGDIVHGSQMSDGAMRTVREGLDLIRTVAEVTLVAGNHEGRSRAFRVLGATVEECERDGWLLVHGDRPAALGRPAIIGHLHPSLHLGGGASVPAFVASDALVIVPALTPYSPGLDLLSTDFAKAIGLWSVRRSDAHVVAATLDRVFPFGSLAKLRETLRSAQPAQQRPPSRFRKRHLRAG
jgi:metallophosphoesterase superfamily enzyme